MNSWTQGIHIKNFVIKRNILRIYPKSIWRTNCCLKSCIFKWASIKRQLVDPWHQTHQEHSVAKEKNPWKMFQIWYKGSPKIEISRSNLLSIVYSFLTGFEQIFVYAFIKLLFCTSSFSFTADWISARVHACVFVRSIVRAHFYLWLSRVLPKKRRRNLMWHH